MNLKTLGYNTELVILNWIDHMIYPDCPQTEVFIRIRKTLNDVGTRPCACSTTRTFHSALKKCSRRILIGRQSLRISTDGIRGWNDVRQQFQISSMANQVSIVTLEVCICELTAYNFPPV
jgi:hypothetical protein